MAKNENCRLQAPGLAIPGPNKVNNGEKALGAVMRKGSASIVRTGFGISVPAALVCAPCFTTTGTTTKTTTKR